MRDQSGQRSLDAAEASMGSTKENFRGDVVCTISFGHLVHDVFSSFLSPFLPLLIAKFSLTMTMAGALSMVFRLTSVLNPVLGVLADRFDLRIWFILSPVMTAACMCLLGHAPNFGAACVMVFVGGASASLLHVVGPVLVAQFSGSRIGRGMSLWMVGGELARTIGPLAAVALVAAVGFKDLYPVMLVGLVTTIYLWSKLRTLPVHRGAWHKMRVFEVMMRMRRLMLVMSGVLLARAMTTMLMMRYLPTYLVASGKSLWVGGIGLALLEFSGVVGALLAGTWSDRIGRRRILAVSMLGGPVFMLLLLNVDGWALAPALILLGFFSMASMPVTLAIIQDSSAEYRGAANGLFMGLSALISSSILFFVGWLVDVMGFKGAFTLCALVGFLGLPLVPLLPKRERTMPPAPYDADA